MRANTLYTKMQKIKQHDTQAQEEAQQQIAQQNEALQAQLKAQSEALAEIISRFANKHERISTEKEFSDFFCDKQLQNMRFRNLSETKRYFETRHANVLNAEMQRLNKKLQTHEFHALLSRLLVEVK